MWATMISIELHWRTAFQWQLWTENSMLFFPVSLESPVKQQNFSAVWLTSSAVWNMKRSSGCWRGPMICVGTATPREYHFKKSIQNLSDGHQSALVDFFLAGICCWMGWSVSVAAMPSPSSPVKSSPIKWTLTSSIDGRLLCLRHHGNSSVTIKSTWLVECFASSYMKKRLSLKHLEAVTPLLDLPASSRPQRLGLRVSSMVKKLCSSMQCSDLPQVSLLIGKLSQTLVNSCRTRSREEREEVRFLKNIKILVRSERCD